MIYLKFCGNERNPEIKEMIVECQSYTVAHKSDLLSIYPEDGLGRHYEVGYGEWLNCFVMSDSGKTIDRIFATQTSKED